MDDRLDPARMFDALAKEDPDLIRDYLAVRKALHYVTSPRRKAADGSEPFVGQEFRSPADVRRMFRRFGSGARMSKVTLRLLLSPWLEEWRWDRVVRVLLEAMGEEKLCRRLGMATRDKWQDSPAAGVYRWARGAHKPWPARRRQLLLVLAEEWGVVRAGRGETPFALWAWLKGIL